MKLRSALITLAAAAVVAAGSALPALAASGATILTNPADKVMLKFAKSTLTAKAGKVTLVMPNPSMLQHNIAIKGKGVNVKGKVVSKGGTSRVTAVLKPGKYTFYCTVPGHEAAGMKGILTVKK